MKKDDFISIRLNNKDKKLLERDAKEQDRSVSNFILWCWKQWRSKKEGKQNGKILKEW